eukprot:scaffold1833_cov255-Pinguiococcus_pyrenoidosus.AAC.15
MASTSRLPPSKDHEPNARRSVFDGGSFRGSRSLRNVGRRGNRASMLDNGNLGQRTAAQRLMLVRAAVRIRMRHRHVGNEKERQYNDQVFAVNELYMKQGQAMHGMLHTLEFTRVRPKSVKDSERSGGGWHRQRLSPEELEQQRTAEHNRHVGAAWGEMTSRIRRRREAQRGNSPAAKSVPSKASSVRKTLHSGKPGGNASQPSPSHSPRSSILKGIAVPVSEDDAAGEQQGCDDELDEITAEDEACPSVATSGPETSEAEEEPSSSTLFCPEDLAISEAALLPKSIAEPSRKENDASSRRPVIRLPELPYYQRGIREWKLAAQPNQDEAGGRSKYMDRLRTIILDARGRDLGFSPYIKGASSR